jgi:hypothetical protein
MDETGAVLFGPPFEAVDLKDINRAARQIRILHGKIPLRLFLVPPAAVVIPERCEGNDVVHRLHTAFVRGLQRIGAGENAEYLGSGGGEARIGARNWSTSLTAR